MRLTFLRPLVLLAATCAAGLPGIRVVDTDGNPVRAEVHAGDGRLAVTAPGYLPWSGPLDPSGAVPVKVVLLRPAVVRGRVVADGVGVAGARVVIGRSGNDSREVAAAISDARGIFDLRDLPLTDLLLSLVAAGFVPLERTLALREGEVRWVEMAPRRAATLRIKVTGSDGQPLRDAEARVRTKMPDGRMISEFDRQRLAGLRTTSDREGRLALGPLDRDVRHRIVLRRDGYAPKSILVTPKAEVMERQVRLQRAGAIRLTFHDRQERAIAGVVAEPVGDDLPDLDLQDAPNPSGQDGVLSLRDLQEGTYALRLRAPGFRPVTLRGVAVRAGQTSDAGLITLEPGSSVAGRVLDEAGAPVRGAGVRAHFYEEGRRVAVEAESDIGGRFLVTGLPDREVEMHVEARGFFPETLGSVRPGSGDVRVILARSGTITGRAVDARSELPVPNFSIEITPQETKAWARSESFRTENTRTDFEDPEGRFEVTGLRAQRYRLIVRARGYRPAEKVEVEARAWPPEPITVRLDAGRAVEGMVLDAEGDAPVVGASVRPGQGEAVFTDLEGRFRVEGLARRTDLHVDHPLYVTGIVRGVDPDAVGPLEIRLARGGSVEGAVYGRDGAPAQGAEVIIQDDGRAATTDSEGHYRLDGVQPGGRVLRKTDSPGAFEGYETALVTVRQGETTVHDFGRGVRLYGTITLRGDPASGALITLAPSGDGTVNDLSVVDPAVTVRAREDGSYEARGMPPGTYGLTLVWEGQAIVGRRVRLEQGAVEQRLDLRIPDLWLDGTLVDSGTGAGVPGLVFVGNTDGRAGGLSGSVEGEDGETIPYSSSPQAQARSDETGRFRVPLLEPGTYTVSAFAEGYTMEKPLEVDVETSRGGLLLELAPAVTLVVKAMDGSTGASLTPNCVSFFAGLNQTSACGAEPRLDFLRPGLGVASAYVQGYAPGYQRVDLRDERYEVAISLTPGGTLQLLLPAQIGSVEVARGRYGLHLENADGIDILLGRQDDFAREGEPAIRHVPAGPLRVHIGGGESGIPEKSAIVNVSEGGETVADLR